MYTFYFALEARIQNNMRMHSAVDAHSKGATEPSFAVQHTLYIHLAVPCRHSSA